MTENKLDCLMNITGTYNNTLAKALSFDASYISRIRSGKRKLPKQTAMLESIAVFFAKKITEDYQKTAAAELICSNETWPDDFVEASEKILSWLESDEKKQADDSLSHINSKQALSDHTRFITRPGNYKVHFGYGNEGKKKLFYELVADTFTTGKPQRILLIFDENINWLYEEKEYLNTIREYLVSLIEIGCKIKTVFNVSRTMTDMLNGISFFAPLILSGSVDAFISPSIRDGINQRTIFVSENRSAMISDSVNNNPESSVSILFDDKETTRIITRQAYDFLSLCRNLLLIEEYNSLDSALDSLKDFSAGDFIDNPIISDQYLLAANNISGIAVIRKNSPFTISRIHDNHVTEAFLLFIRRKDYDFHV